MTQTKWHTARWITPIHDDLNKMNFTCLDATLFESVEAAAATYERQRKMGNLIKLNFVILMSLAFATPSTNGKLDNFTEPKVAKIWFFVLVKLVQNDNFLVVNGLLITKPVLINYDRYKIVWIMYMKFFISILYLKILLLE